MFICTVITPSVAVDTIQQSSMSIPMGKTLNVGGSGGGNYTTIQKALNDAHYWDTVFVYDDSSPYKEHIVVRKSINLIGEDRDTTVIDGGEFGTVVRITADKVTVSGFTIKGSGGLYYNEDAGIQLAESDNNIITGNIISNNNYYGIYLGTSKYNNITGNTISKNDYGIYLSNSISNTITDNHCSKNHVGIFLGSSSSNTITANNVISNRDLGIYIGWYGAKRNNVTGNTIANHKKGIYLDDGDNNIIIGNFISNNIRGIELFFSSNNNIIMGNTILNNLKGIKNDDSKNNTIKGNNIKKNMYGIDIEDCIKIIITNNNIQKNIIGCKLYYSSSVIEKNNFIGNIKQATHISSLNTTWDSNYWSNRLGMKIGLELFQKFPKIIFGRYRFIVFFPWLQLDRHPSQEPYDIEVVI